MGGFISKAGGLSRAWHHKFSAVYGLQSYGAEYG